MVLCGCVGFCQIGFMRLTDYKHELAIKQNYHAFIMKMCMMNIFVVCFLQGSCSRMRKPVEVYTNWYMMWYQKRHVLQGTYLSGLFRHLQTVCPLSNFLANLSIIWWSGHHLLSTGHIPCWDCLCILHLHSHSSDACCFCRSRDWSPGLIAWSFL